MKTAINIKPAVTDQFTVVGEVGWYGATFIWLYNDSIQGMVSYYFDNEPEYAKASHLKEIVKKHYSNTNVPAYLFYNFFESSLIPKEFYKVQKEAEMLEPIFDYSANATILTDESDDLMNIYAVPSGLHQFILENNIHWKHSGTCQHSLDDNVYCIFYNNALKLVLHKNDQVHLIQQFGFRSAHEAAYHILNACRQCDIQPSEEKLVIAGMIDQDSPMFKELRKYFNEITFAEQETPVTKNIALSAYPDHFFHHLISQLACVS